MVCVAARRVIMVLCARKPTLSVPAIVALMVAPALKTLQLPAVHALKTTMDPIAQCSAERKKAAIPASTRATR